MTTNVVNHSPYLRTAREFPEESKDLAFHVNKSYVDIANCVNARTIGLFPTNRSAITGESWFLSGNRRQQSLRQVYNITSYAPIAHGIDFRSVSTLTVIRAIGFDGTNYYPIPYINPNIPNGGVGIYVDPTNINFLTNAGFPVIVRGFVLLEWLSNV